MSTEMYTTCSKMGAGPIYVVIEDDLNNIFSLACTYVCAFSYVYSLSLFFML